MKYYALSLLIISLLACSDNSGKKIADLTQKLTKLDQEMAGANVTDKAKALDFIQTSEILAPLVEKSNQEQYVDVTLKAAGLAKTIGQPQKAIELYQKIADGLPNHPKAPTALFMLGFVYENDLNNLDKAKAIYQDFLKKYPNDPDFADDARNSLKNLGKSPEELIKEFEQQQQQQPAQ